MNVNKLLTLALIAAAAALPSSRALAADDAKVVKLTGNATMTLPGQTTPTPLEVGMAIPKGALISTDATGEAYVETIPGAIATIEPDTQVLVEEIAIEREGDKITSQTSMLDLKQGNIVSTIDPSKKDINHYGIRTPKGVAAARGTSYGVSMNLGTVQIATTASSVTLTSPGGLSVVITAGSASINGGAPVPLASVYKSNPSVAALINNAAKAVNTIVGVSGFIKLDAGTAATLITQVTAVASTANPTDASAYAKAAVQAVTENSSIRASGSGSIDSAAAAITAAAVTANPSDAPAIAAAAASASGSSAAAIASSAATAATASSTSTGAANTAAANIAAAVTSAVTSGDQGSTAATQAAATIAAAVTIAVPSSSTAVTASAAGAAGVSTSSVSTAITTQATQAAAAAATQNANTGTTTQQTTQQTVNPTVVSPSG